VPVSTINAIWGRKTNPERLEETMGRRFQNILETVGRTPVVRINRLAPPDVKLYVKVEAFNPLGSVKDRLALGVIEAAEKSGELKPGQTVIEATSGNTGIGLAMVCAAKGYPLVLTMAEPFSVERRKLMRFLGAKVIITPAGERAVGMPTQISIRERPPARSSTIFHPAFKPHPMQGWTPDFIPKLTEDARKMIDRVLPISGADAIRCAKDLAAKEGIFVGISAGGTFAGALKIAAEAEKGATILCMLPDTGERYLSTPLFADIPADMTDEETAISRSTPSAQLAR
jgi:cysteine synthase